MAISCARRILWMVSGHHAPALTVASLATITAGRPSMRAEPGDHARGGRLAVVLVVGDQQADFEKRRAVVDQLGDALARGELAGGVLLLDFLLPAAQAQRIFQLLIFVHQRAHVVGADRGGGSGGHAYHGNARAPRFTGRPPAAPPTSGWTAGPPARQGDLPVSDSALAGAEWPPPGLGAARSASAPHSAAWGRATDT